MFRQTTLNGQEKLMASMRRSVASSDTLGVAGMYRQLNLLNTRYGRYVDDESLTSELACLQALVWGYLNGSPEATEQLQEHGRDMIVHIRESLQHAEKEIQRMDEESPNAENFSGGMAHRLSRAASIACKIEEMMQELIQTPASTYAGSTN